MAPLSLRKRFEAFVETLDQFESIDALLQGCDPAGKKRADYLLENRQFIIEQKVLISDPSERPQRFVEKLQKERGFIFYGALSTDYLFSKQPDAEDLKRRMLLDLARTVDDIVATADKQTNDTRTIFNIPDAPGILVILNEGAQQLRPDIIQYALWNTLGKKTPTGAFRYRANRGVILISEAHRLANDNPSERPCYPIVFFGTPGKTHDVAVSTFADRLVQRWAEFNNAPLIEMTAESNQFPTIEGTAGRGSPG